MRAKTAFAAAGISLVLAASVSACSAPQQADVDGSKAEPVKEEKIKKTASVGDDITVSTKNGNYTVKVIGFETSEKMRAQFSDYDKMKPENTIGLLLLEVRNDSYDDKYNPGYISLGKDVYAVGGDGIAISPMNSSVDYGEYEGAAGAFFECPVGKAVRIAVFHQVPADMSGAVTVSVGGTDVECPVSVGL